MAHLFHPEPYDHASGRPSSGDAQVLFEDRFDEELPPGRVIGSTATSGVRRLGKDREDALSVDHSALRIRFLQDPGWDRAAVSYGPFQARPGLALSTRVTNGLATSQTYDDEPLGTSARLKRTLKRWRRTFPRIDWTAAKIHESLAVGWFEVPASSRRGQRPPGSCVVAWSTPETEVGKLKVAGSDGDRPVLEDVQNTPLTIVAIFRGDDVVLYASSIDDVYGLAAHPRMRPLGIVAAPASDQVYAGVHQAVLGEVHYRLDTRVDGVKAVVLPHVAWDHGALVADRFRDLPVAPGAMRPFVEGEATRTPAGLTPRGTVRVAADPAEPVGLLRLDFTLGDPDAMMTLRWRAKGTAGCELRITPRGTVLVVIDASGAETLVAAEDTPIAVGAHHSLQVTDDGDTVAASLSGRRLIDPIRSLAIDGSGVELTARAEGDRTFVTMLEAHPRSVPIPGELDLGAAAPTQGKNVVVEDDFQGPAEDLAGRTCSYGQRRWRRVLGDAVFETTGSGEARVRGTRDEPAPGRTIYVLDWHDHDIADVEVTVIPPGTGRGQRHQGRSGLVLWQDADNHLAVNHFIDDTSIGVSISAFLRVHGHEVMHDNDATWTNVAGRIRFGVPFRLRLSSDGTAFTVWVDDEAVLHRRYSDYRATADRLRINGVGLLTNWEWGDDTGSRFREFRASGW